MLLRALSAAAIAMPLLAAPALAQSVKLLGEFRDWAAYTATESTGPVCFALSKPTTVAPSPDDFGGAWLYLTNRPSEGVRNEINLVAGFTFAPDTPARAVGDYPGNIRFWSSAGTRLDGEPSGGMSVRHDSSVTCLSPPPKMISAGTS